MPRFILLLRRPTETGVPDAPEALRERIGKYRAWREELAREGQLVAGEKFSENQGLWLRKNGEEIVTDAGPDPALGSISGYFLIQANDDREARGIAEQCPHLLFGGTIELREIEPT